MIISLALVLLVTASGTLASYLYDEGASFAARLCAGACVGLAALGLGGFVFASFLGLTPLAILLSLLVVIALPLLSLRNPKRRALVRHDLRATYQSIREGLFNPTRIQFGYALFYVAVAAVLWRAFQRAMIDLPEGIFTGVLNNFGDLPFHLSVITSFAFGNNFPPEDPTYAGVRFTYPFLTDFVSAIFVRCGADLRQSMFIENFVVALAFVGLLHRWALEMLRDRLAAVITPLLVLLSGGLGWVLLLNQVPQKNDEGLLGMIQNLPSSFTVIPETTWRWGNAVSTLLIPQRGFLLGLPLAVIVFTQWWLAGEKPGERETREAEERGKRGVGEQGKRVKGKGKKRKKQKQATIDVSPASAMTSELFSASPLPFSRIPRFSTLSVRRMIAAGVVAGLLPLVHAHSFVVVMVVGGCIALALYWRAWLMVIGSLIIVGLIFEAMSSGLLSMSAEKPLLGAIVVGLPLGLWFLLPSGWRDDWYAFFVTALIVALPQLWWSTHNSAVNSSAFFAYEVGWDSAKEHFFNFKFASQTLETMPRLRIALERFPDVVWFWLKNAGLFIPLTVAALLWRSEKKRLVPRRLLLFLLPFSLCFIVPNFLKMAPWIWDNIKVLFYWWLASAPLVALLLARLWRDGGPKRAIALVLLVCVTLAGGLDVAAIALRSNQYGIFDAQGISFAELIKREVPPNAVVLHAPVHNHPVFLTGRRSLMGYPGHVWTHGLEYLQRESEIKRVYAGAPDADEILRKYGVEYAVVSPLERNELDVNEQFFSKFQIVGEVGGYRLYKITQP